MSANSVIDISHHNGKRLRFDKAKADGIVGVIQKATQGGAYVDATLEEARTFVTHIHDELGRWPGFYSGHTIKRALGTTIDPVLTNCWFWLAQYGPTAVVPPCWSTWTMWQYTDGGVGPTPHTVDGIGSCDRNYYNGTDAQLKSWWAK